jgi:hypothetical protein
MRFDDFMYGGDMYGGDMFGAYGGADLPSFAVAPQAPAPPSLSVTPPGAYASGAVEAPFGTYDRTLSAVGLGPQADPRSMYTPEQLAYFDQQAAYTAAENALGYDVTPLKQFVTSAPIYDRREDVQGGTVAPSDNFQRPRGQQRYLTSEEVDAQMAAANAFNPDIANRFGTNIYGGPNAQTRVSYADQPFRLYNKGQLVFEGVGRDDALKATQMAQGFTDVGGNKADWKLETKLGPTADYITVAEDAADVSGVMGAFVNYGIPLLVAAANPAAFLAAVGGAGTTAATATAAQLAGAAAAAGAVGGGLSKAIQGASIGEIAKTAGIQAATAGLMAGTPVGQAITGGINSAVKSVAPGLLSSAPGALAQVAPSLADEIVVTASRSALPSLLSGAATSAIGSGLSNLSNSLLPSQPATTQALDPDLITVTGVRPNDFLSNVGSALPAASSLAVQTPSNELPEVVAEARKLPAEPATVVPPVSLAVTPLPNELPEVVAEASKVTKDPLTVPVPPVPSLAVQTPSNELPEVVAEASKVTKQDDAPITVTASRFDTPKEKPGDILTNVGSVLPGLPGQALDTPAPPADKKLSVSDYIKLAGLAATGIGMLGGGGGEGTAAGNVPGGLGRLNPIFSAKLPTGADVNIPGGVGTASNFAARPMGDEDWLTYGQRPEKSFFNYVPQPPTGMAHGGSLAAKRGGRPSRSSFAVSGAGTGRSDDIPAVLSDGEYVIDAETVALLGDGSSKAGAKKLDDLRVKIRKHKGQRLSQGRFSSDAKKPEAYLTGGRI